MVRPNDWRYLLTVPLLYLTARYTGGTLPHAIAYFWLALLLIAYLWTWATLRQISVLFVPHRRRYVAGEPLELHLRIDNEGILPITACRLSDVTDSFFPLTGQPGPWLSLPTFGTALRRDETTPTRRGVYRLGPFELEVSDPLGLFTGRATVASPFEVVVYPRVKELHHLPLPLRQPFGHVRVKDRAYEDASELADVRPMLPGDSPRRIHWKITAHRGEPHVKEYERLAASSVLILLDLSAASYRTRVAEERLDTAIEVAAAIARYSLVHENPTGLMAYQDRLIQIPFGKGLRHLGNLLEPLARVRPGSQRTLPELIHWAVRHQPPLSTLVVVSPSARAEHLEAATLARRQGISLLFVEVAARGYGRGLRSSSLVPVLSVDSVEALDQVVTPARYAR